VKWENEEKGREGEEKKEGREKSCGPDSRESPPLTKGRGSNCPRDERRRESGQRDAL